MIKIYHNNRCGKSRSALQILQEKGIDFEVVEYLKNPLTQKQLKGLLKKLGLKASELIRTKEPLFKETYAGKNLSESDYIKLLIENPILMERPIIETEEKAIVARPPELALEVL
ncbi:MAG: arsenate reductase (glutaredoxin) [Bacteroidia bacterium]